MQTSDTFAIQHLKLFEEKTVLPLIQKFYISSIVPLHISDLIKQANI